MRILLLTLIVPYPPDSGPKVKTYHLLRYLAQHHSVTLVSLVRSPQEEAHAAALRTLCDEVYTVPLTRSRVRDVFYFVRSLLAGTSFIVERDANAALDRLLHTLTHNTFYDVIHVDQLNMARFAAGLRGGIRVLDQHNAVWTIVHRMAQHTALLPKRIFLEWEAAKLRTYEAEMCARFDAVMTVSEPDRWALRLACTEQYGAQSTAAASLDYDPIPIAVDTEVQPVVTREPDARTITSMATMFWPPNVDGVLWFAREVYPLVKQRIPDVRFCIIGARPPHAVVQLAEKDASIEVTGYVDDPQPYLAKSAALIVPVRAGGGMRVKILEALARGIPIVTTTVGYEGIDVAPGQHLLVGDAPEAFAEALIRLIQHPEQGRRMAAAGRRFVEQTYDWRVVYPHIEAIYAAHQPAPIGHSA